jgi:DNA-binding MarR family transcriptional regulator
MQPTTEDVKRMIAALFTISEGLERARRRIPAAATLDVLQALAAHEGARPSEVAARLGLNPSSVSRHVQALERAGHVEVHADPDDARAAVVVVTPAGQDELRRLTEIGLQRFASFVADWDAEEVRMLSQLLEKLESSKNAVVRRAPGRAEQRHPNRPWQDAARPTRPRPASRSRRSDQSS